MASTAASSCASRPDHDQNLGTVKFVVVDSVCQRMNSTIRPTPIPIANPPHKNASSCSIGRGLLSIITVKPIQLGSKLNSDCHYHYRGLKTGTALVTRPSYAAIRSEGGEVRPR